MEVSELDKKYFVYNILETGHKFNGRNWIPDDDSIQECLNCRLSFGSFINYIKCLKHLYLLNSHNLTFEVNRNGIKDNGFIEYNSLQDEYEYDYENEKGSNRKSKSESVSYKSKTCMTSRFFNVFKVKFVDRNYECCTVKLAIDL